MKIENIERLVEAHSLMTKSVVEFAKSSAAGRYVTTTMQDGALEDIAKAISENLKAQE